MALVTCNLPLLCLAKHADLQVVAYKFCRMAVHGTYSYQHHGSLVSRRRWSLGYSPLVLLSSRVGLKCTLLHFLRPPPSLKRFASEAINFAARHSLCPTRLLPLPLLLLAVSAHRASKPRAVFGKRVTASPLTLQGDPYGRGTVFVDCYFEVAY